MSNVFRGWFVVWARLAVAALWLVPGMAALADQDSPVLLLQQLDEFPHARQVDFSQKQVIDYEVGLGAIQKVRGTWQFKDSERRSGKLTRYTWQIVDGFTSLEVMQELESELQQRESLQALFQCEGRACGSGAQWANRVFHQRILYGREGLQQYAVYRLDEAMEYRLSIFSAARTADRQYLHVELLEVSQQDGD